MRVVLHSLADDVRDLVHLTVVHALHGMEYTALNRFETIFDCRHSSFKYHVRSIVQEPVLVHAREVILDSIIETALGRHSLFALFIDEDVG